MRWVQFILDDLKPAFGGIPTFCEDPDRLLELSPVREALRAAGMTIQEWDGCPDTLERLKELGSDDKPLLLVSDPTLRHLVEARLTDFRWESISIGEMMPKFHHGVVRAVPTEQWDTLLRLHDQERSPRSPQETAVLIGRALFGVDPEYLKFGNGWLRLLVRVGVAGESLPEPIAAAVAVAAPVPTYLNGFCTTEILTDPAAARAALATAKETDPHLLDAAGPSEQLLLEQMHVAERRRGSYQASPSAPDLLAHWERAAHSPLGVLEFGEVYCNAVAEGLVTEEVRLEVNTRFVPWLMGNYGTIQSAPNPQLLRLSRLVETLDAECGEQKLLLVVVDALGLPAWSVVKEIWRSEGVIGGYRTRVALAVVPTITALSRRAIFEGKLPSQSSSKPHSAALERRLWADRFGDGEYFTVDENLGFSDCMDKGRPRVCVVDVTWDKLGHHINPSILPAAQAARTWAVNTPLRQFMRHALDGGYRVIITADHGQVECVGQGRPNVGDLPEERSKRVLLFADESTARSFETETRFGFRPTGMPLDRYPLFPAGFTSFDQKGAVSVSHGGLSLEETLVPVAEVLA